MYSFQQYCANPVAMAAAGRALLLGGIMAADGLCECGCGQKTNVPTQNNRGANWVKGVPMRFIKGHANRGKTGKDHPVWKGGRYTQAKKQQYVLQYAPGHSRNPAGFGYVAEHILIAERVLGKPLPARAQVHHLDGDGRNNAHSNLVICEDAAYHQLLHRRRRALDACGHASWEKCWVCKQYDDPVNIVARYASHRVCQARYWREQRAGKVRRKCCFCHKLDRPENMKVHGRGFRHPACFAQYQRERRARQRQEQS